MVNKLFDEAFSIATLIVGVAIVAVLVSKSANTATVLTSAGTAFGNVLKEAVSPVSGNSLGI